LEEWKFDARDGAFTDLFEGSDAALTDEELRLLDTIDSDLTRQDGIGLWDADEYGIVAGETVDAEAPLVVCTYHPKSLTKAIEAKSLDEATRKELNDVLWNYCERVAEIILDDLKSFSNLPRRADQNRYLSTNDVGLPVISRHSSKSS